MVPLALLPLLLIACKAEQLGVDVPRGGADAISQEDLQRDTFHFDELSGERAPGKKASRVAAQRLVDRYQQMHLLPAFGDGYELPAGPGASLVCGRKDGKGDEGLVIIALDADSGARGGAVPLAVSVSLAKAWDVPAQPAQTVVICGGPAELALDTWRSNPGLPWEKTRQVVLLGAWDGGSLGRRAEQLDGVEILRLQQEAALPAEDRADTVDFRRLEEGVRALAQEVQLKLAR